MPKVLADARANLKNPPRIYTEIAIEQLPGNISLLRKRCAAGVQGRQGRQAAGRFPAANQAVIAALQEYETFLKTDLLPRSNGDFRLGAENFSKKLLYEEMVDIPLDRLLEIGYDEPAREPAEVPRDRREDRSRARRRSRFWRTSRRIIPRPTNCWMPSANASPSCAISSRRRKSSPFRRRCCRFWKRRRRSCAR